MRIMRIEDFDAREQSPEASCTKFCSRRCYYGVLRAFIQSCGQRGAQAEFEPECTLARPLNIYRFGESLCEPLLGTVESSCWWCGRLDGSSGRRTCPCEESGCML
jgi:hypothetical protein